MYSAICLCAVAQDIRSINQDAVIHKTTGIQPIEKSIWSAVVELDGVSE